MHANQTNLIALALQQVKNIVQEQLVNNLRLKCEKEKNGGISYCNYGRLAKVNNLQQVHIFTWKLRGVLHLSYHSCE